MTTRAIATLFVIVLAIGAAVQACWPKPARAHDPYSQWKAPNNPNVSCCNNEDCRPTRAYLGDDGLWRAWNGKEWLTVPPDRMLPTDYAKDGRSHLCEKMGYIYCFSGAEPKS